jgi:outer membrane protein insertion porin family
MNLRQKLRLLFCSCFLSISFSAFAADGFVVQKIEIQGLQRIPAQTVLEYLPVHVGQTIHTADTGAIIHALYQTGFFGNVSLSRKGDVLVVQVSERPTIGLIKISGNKQIKTKDLTAALKKAGITEGAAYDQALLDGMKQAMIGEYHKAGRYDATVEIKAVEQTRNRMAVNIQIGEGKVAKLDKIEITGNKAFTSGQLLKHFSLGKKPWWAFFSSKDQYSEEKVQADLKSLQEFYLDHGYLRFKVDSYQADMTADKKYVTVKIQITEGVPYRIKGYRLSGILLGQEAAANKIIKLKAGEVFSRQKVVAINDALGRLYGDQGYALAKVDAEPEIDDANSQVFLTFKIMPGQRVYVRNINYFGNTRTADEVLRRETRQMEGGVYSISQQDETKRRLNNLGYLENIESKMEPVPGKLDQTDLRYDVKEASSTTATAQVGYSDAYGFLYGANITQKNFRGSGKTVALGFNNSEYAQSYSFNYFNPYYTESGISRGFSLYFQHVTPDQSNIAAYTLDSYGGMMNYRIPMSEYDYFSFGYGYEYLSVKSNDSSVQIADFINQNGSNFNNFKITAGWTHNTYDRAILPTEGFNQWLGLEAGLPGLPNSLQYYRLNYDASLYHPLGKGFIAVLNTDLGYGNGYGNMDHLPFFKNYYAGGMGTVRGYAENTLGPRDSLDNALGGNVLASANAALIIPTPLDKYRVRTSLFFDAGNVFQDTVNLSDIRYSTGIEVDWASPMGPLKISLGQALNSKDGDNTRLINFSIGTSF